MELRDVRHAHFRESGFMVVRNVLSPEEVATLRRRAVADPGNPPPGCSFHPRCPFAEDRCRHEVPELRQVGDRWMGCHRADELDLAS